MVRNKATYSPNADLLATPLNPVENTQFYQGYIWSFSVFEKVPKIDNAQVETTTDFCLFVAIPA